MSAEVRVTHLPACDMCGEPAAVDGKTVMGGRWAYMCERDWHTFGVGRLGTGYGQRLVVEQRKSDEGSTTP